MRRTQWSYREESRRQVSLGMKHHPRDREWDPGDYVPGSATVEPTASVDVEALGACEGDHDMGPVVTGSWEILDSSGEVCGLAETEEEAQNRVRYAASRGMVRTYRRRR